MLSKLFSWDIVAFRSMKNTGNRGLHSGESQTLTVLRGSDLMALPKSSWGRYGMNESGFEVSCLYWKAGETTREGRRAVKQCTVETPFCKLQHRQFVCRAQFGLQPRSCFKARVVEFESKTTIGHSE
jgi:hypothetical protein